MSHLDDALRDAELTDVDDRGLMPLSDARRHLQTVSVVERHNLDATWAALLSLENAEEFVATALRLTWEIPPRGMENTAPVERYGAGVLPWLASHVADGILVNHPWCVVPCLLALDEQEAFELLYEARGVEARELARAGDPTREAERLLLEWVRRHDAIGNRALVRRAHQGDDRAEGLVRQLARANPTATWAHAVAAIGATDAEALFARLGLTATLEPSVILEALDRGCLARDGGTWPWFHCGVDGRMEYFGLRLVAVRQRDGDGWGVVLERLQGSDPDMLCITRSTYGPYGAGAADFEHRVDIELEMEGESDHVFHGWVVRGPGGELALDESLFARFDLRPGLHTEEGSWSQRVLAIRAFLEVYPDAWWPPVDGAVAASGVPNADLIVASRAFEHAVGELRPQGLARASWHVLPSESITYRSLAEAIVERDAARFEPGPSNLDWRLHAVLPASCPLPWERHRVDTSGGWLAAAMAEAGVETDERGLMALEEAREVVGAAQVFARGSGAEVSGVWVWESDRLWAALLSLEDGAEAAEAVRRLSFDGAPRDDSQNTALAERYGDGVVAVLASREGDDGVLVGGPACFVASLMATASPAAFAYLWDLDGYAAPDVEDEPKVQASALFAQWMSAHPRTGYVELARLAETGDETAAGILLRRGGAQPRRVYAWIEGGLGAGRADALYAALGLTTELLPGQILSLLDEWCRPDLDAWPPLWTGRGPSVELHAVRLCAGRAREGDDWLVLLERFQGYHRSLSIQRYAYGENAEGGLRPDLERPMWEVAREHGVDSEAGPGPIEEDAAVLREPPDYWTQYDRPEAHVGQVRALLDHRPEVVWEDAGELLARAGLDDLEVVVDTAHFEHVDGPTVTETLPSQSACWTSLAEALVSREPDRFQPGTANNTWRQQPPRTDR